MAEKKISSKAVHETVNALPGFPINIHTFEGCVEKYSICPRHWHRSLEITYRIRYKGHLFVNNRKTELVSDKVILINSGEIHEIHREPLADMRAVLIQIPYEYMKAAVPDIDDYYFSVDSDDEILTGFQNSRTFCSAFKKMYGETPQQFLKKKLQIAEEN